MLIFIFFIITSLPALFLYSLLRRIHKDVPKADAIIGVLYFISILVFIVGMEVHDNEFSVAIDSVDMNCYTPISFQHSLTFCYYFISFNLATAVIWVKENRLPPLTLAALLSAIIAGIIHQVALLLQITQHNRQSIQQYDNDGTVFFIWMPVIAIFIGIVILIRTLQNS
ncbi:hypothetical protein LRS05_03255 [Flavobacterium sp. J372]|uniref:DUF6688 domain-containing protein n=1 Tax=Flavobacterium sp. J372 TaxID=2898436 RepID=UPI002150ED7D|nr:DUF6688 family protein [Flavobacterium sp. J372]MCR5861221.1 hypothetical protein [Flavobacterium sp. J372]